MFAKEAREGQNAEDKAERLMAATGHHLEVVIALLRQRNTSTLRWPLEACESLNTQDRAEHLTAETGVMATCHLLGIAEQVSGNPSDTQSAFRQLWKKYGGVFIKRMCIVCAKEARGASFLIDFRASHGGDWPPSLGHDGHLPSTWYCL